MNKILTAAVTTTEAQAQMVKNHDQVSRETLYNFEENNYYIKDGDKYVLLGGNGKQNFLTAGDNIEIIDDDPEHPIIRLADDVVVKTLTLSPGTEEDPILDWKGTIKLGTLKDGNTVYLITKATEIASEDQALFGGQILVRMHCKDGKDVYAQYAVTITSTGSWSLWGGANAGTNLRVCKAKYNNEWYYGLKIPAGDFQNVRQVDTPTYKNTKDTGANNRLYFQIGDEPDSYFVGWAGKGKNGTKLQFEEDLGTLTGYPDVTVKKYSISVKDLVDNEFLEEENGEEWQKVISNDEIKENQWARWYENGDKIYFEIATRLNYVYTWKVLETSGDITLHWNGRTSYNTCNFSLSTDNANRNLTECGVASPDPNDPEEANLSSYNHWYSMSMLDFQSLLGFNLAGEWASFVTNHHIICFRIYYKFSTSNWGQQTTRITRIQIRDTNGTDTTNGLGGTAGEIVYDFKTSAEDMPFSWDDTDLVNLTRSPSDVYYPHTSDTISKVIGHFYDRKAIPEGEPVSETIAIQGIEYPSDLEDNIVSAKYDITYYRANTNQCKGWTYSSPIPLFMDWSEANSTTLKYNSGNNSWCFMMDVFPTWLEITGHRYTNEYFIDNLDIESADLWYNGWYDLPESLVPPQPNTSQLDFQVLARESQDADSYSEVFFFNENDTATDVVNKIDSLQPLGEDAPPYYMQLNRTLTLADLRLIAEHIKQGDRQIYLDLGNCTMAAGNTNWNEAIFTGCISLRGLVVPKGITNMQSVPFMWCTYMRELDLTPSGATLDTIGGGQWGMACGLLTSTRVTTLLVPRSVNNFGSYLVYSSNVKNLILLHRDASDGKIALTHNTWYGTSPTKTTDTTLPEGFKIFVEASYEYTIKHPDNTWQSFWSPNSDRTAYNSITVFNKDWSQAEWQEFENKNHWGEELINRVRREFGKTSDIEILNYMA